MEGLSLGPPSASLGMISGMCHIGTGERERSEPRLLLWCFQTDFRSVFISPKACEWVLLKSPSDSTCLE